MNYRKNSVNVSKKCIDLNKRMLRGEKISQETSGLSKGEWREFIEAFDLGDVIS
jgi:thymidylate synthase (FAD)